MGSLWRLTLGIILVCTGVGCAEGVPFQAVAPPPGKAVVYVYQPTNGYIGSGVNFQLKADDVKFGDLQNDAYIYTILSPGKHVISCETESKSAIPFVAEPGKSYYIEAAVKMGFWLAEPRLTMVPEETGKLAILGMKDFRPESIEAAKNATAPQQPTAAQGGYTPSRQPGHY